MQLLWNMSWEIHLKFLRNFLLVVGVQIVQKNLYFRRFEGWVVLKYCLASLQQVHMPSLS